MTRRPLRLGMAVAAALLLVGAGGCLYRAIDLDVTAEEGLKYSIPGMQRSAGHTKDDVARAKLVFGEMERLGDRWGDAAGVLFLMSAGCAAVWWRVRA
ncbi:MAG: hypothetical protein V4555_09025 [Acidobacteriota bacterium]